MNKIEQIIMFYCQLLMRLLKIKKWKIIMNKLLKENKESKNKFFHILNN